MPIRLPRSLPAFDVLSREGVMVMGQTAADQQDIRPMRIGILNLMPKKIQTENQYIFGKLSLSCQYVELFHRSIIFFLILYLNWFV